MVFYFQAKNTAHRDLVKKSSTDGIAVVGESRRQTFSQQFVAEALILSDLFDLNELAAVELLMAGGSRVTELVWTSTIDFPTPV